MKSDSDSKNSKLLWSFGTGVTGNEIYGSIGSCVTVKDGVVTTSNILDVNDDSICQQFKGKTPSKKGPKSADAGKKTRTPKPKPGPGQAVLPLQIQHKEHVAAACRRNAKSPTTCNSLPASLSHPVLLVTSDSDGGMEVISSSSLLSFQSHHQYLLVPKDGDFTFRSIGYSAHSSHSESGISWKFCGFDGTLGDSLTFTMSDGQCSVAETSTRSTCSDPFVILQDPTPLETIQDQAQDLTRLFTSIIAAVLFVTVGLVTAGLVLSKKFSPSTTTEHEFSRLDATESGQKSVELEPIPSHPHQISLAL